MALHSSQVRSLGEAWRLFLGRPSPRWLAAGVALALAARLALGQPTWHDVAIPALVLAVYPFGEWAIHVYLLHLKPFGFRGRRVELITAREHRWHHERPHDLHTVLLGPKEIIGLLAVLIPLVALALAALVAPLGGGFAPRAVVSATAAGGVLVFVYEWTHFLIHTAHRPRSRLYRAVWRTHRLHHFKNEHFWHGITSTLADRALGTSPDARSVERSPTARTLDPNGQVRGRA